MRSPARQCHWLGFALLVQLLFPGSAPVFAQEAAVRSNPLRVNVSAVSNTQAVLSYSAPEGVACRVKVSRQQNLSPLAIDVDPNLFPGADMDSRAEAIVNRTSRIFIAGQRITQKAADGKNYSRALETYAPHYYQVTCGSATASGQFTTGNIPLGMTYNEVPQVDGEHPGQWLIPTMLQDRTQAVIDPQTGAFLRRISLDSEAGNRSYGYYGAFLTYGGFNRVCSKEMTGPTPSKRGYLCVFPDYGLQLQLLYFIVPSTGETQFLGMVPHVGAMVNGSDLSFYYGADGNIYRSTYAGNFAPATGQQVIKSSPPVLYSAVSMGNLMKRFDPTFDDKIFNCSAGIAGPGQYSLVICGRSVQDSYGWIGAFYGGDGRPIATNCEDGDKCPRIVAAMNVFSVPATRWCGLHNVQMVPENPLISINFQNLHNPGGELGVATMATKLSAAVAAGDKTITVDGEPASTAPGGDPVQQNAAVGDTFVIGANPSESVKITDIKVMSSGQRVWTVTRANPARAFPAGTVLWADCTAGFRLTYWKFLNDPHGTDAANQNVVVDGFWDGGGHADAGPLGRVTEYGPGWAAVFGKVIDNLNRPLSLVIDDSPFFAGVHGLDYGNTTSKHPSYHQDASQTPLAEQRWFLDMLAFDGGNLFSDNPGAVLISGQLYKYKLPGNVPLARKQLATLASTGGSSLLDISGPGSSLSDLSPDAYKYCVANVTGECRPGSAPGDVFVNAPDVKYLVCSGGDGPNPQNRDICVGNIGAWAQGMTQVYLGSTPAESVANSRIVTRGLAGIKDMFYYSTAKSLPDASWALFNVGSVAVPNPQVNVWMAKLTPLVKQDNVDRSTFMRAPISVTAPQGMRIASAAIEFGYTEQGAPGQHYCTSRREACVATAATVTDANPFSFAQTETYTRMPCANSCTITLPVLPAHVAYYQVKFYDAAGALVTSGDRSVAMEGLPLKSTGASASPQK
ncbi:MAG: hypothetical protein ABI759_03780 [Candidatus Solibacter sp.]